MEGSGLDPEPIGTAVWICGHLALTARHNIEYIVRKYGAQFSDENSGEVSSYAIRLYQIWPGPEYAIWEVRTAWCSAESDLALLHLSLWGHTAKQPPNPAFGLRLKGLPPTVGSRVAGFGYHSSTTNFIRHPDGNYHLDLNDVPQSTTGVVRAVFAASEGCACICFR